MNFKPHDGSIKLVDLYQVCPDYLATKVVMPAMAHFLAPRFLPCFCARVVTYHVGMDSHDLTPEQAIKIMQSVRPGLAYLDKLKTRMERRSFASDDELYRQVISAHRSLGDLYISLHYLSCEPGSVGRKD